MIEILWKMKWSCFQVSFVYSWIIDYRNLFWELSDKNVILFIDGHKRIYELPWGRLIYMVTNFDYLKNESKFSAFAGVAISAEKIILLDPEACIMNCRRAMEFAVKWMWILHCRCRIRILCKA